MCVYIYIYIKWASLVTQTVKKLHFSIPGSGRAPGEGKGYTHSSILAWRIPWTENPDRLQSLESQRVGHDWALIQAHTIHYTHDGILFSHKKNKMFLFATVWMNLEGISLSEISQEEKDILYVFTYMWILKKQNKWTNITKQKELQIQNKQVLASRGEGKK